MAQLDGLPQELNSPDPKQRQEAVRTLARLRAVEAIDVLQRVAEHDPDETVRALAAGAVDFLQREHIEAPLRKPHRRATDAPDLSEGALRDKEEALRARQLGIAEYILIGVLVILGAVVLIMLLAGGFNALRARFEASLPLRSRDEIVAEMRQAISAAREGAEQLRQVPTLIAGSPGGLACENLPAIPATYGLPDPELDAYPELGVAESALYEAHIAIHNVEAQWRRQCQDGRLMAAPAHVTIQAETFINAGLEALAEVELELDRLPPLTSTTPTAVSYVVY